MSILDLNQVKEYIQALTGDVNTSMTWQIFYDPQDGTERDDLATHFTSSVSSVEPILKRAESQLCGVYVCINPTSGGRHAKHVTKIRAVFADFDGIEEPRYPIKPHLVTRRDATHGHAYWLVDDVKVEDYKFLQRRIATSLGTDIKVTDPSRVARVCGTAHMKVPTSPQMYTVVQNNELPKYTHEQILDAFQFNDEQEEDYDKWCSSRESMTNGDGNFDDNEFEIARFITFLTHKAEPAQESIGSGGTGTVIKVCNLARDYGISLETTQALAWEHYNPRCIPPWGEHERSHFDNAIAHGFEYCRNTVGCRTTLAAFDGIEITPMATKEGEKIAKIGDRISRMKAKLISPVMNAKSPHYELAQVFDGVMYEGCNIIRVDEIFYEFGGKSWGMVGDKWVKSLVQKFYARLKPSDSLVRGVFNSFCDMVSIFEVHNGCYITTGKDGGDVVSFKNGLVDLNRKVPVVKPHTPNYFCYNELSYDYEPNATCPQWIEFLDSIWGDDQELKDQLQDWFGYCMVNSTDMQKFALFIGKPRGGKGVITDMLMQLVGVSNTVAPSLAKFSNDSSLHRMSTAKLALIPDAHSVHASKRDEVLSNIKAITGGDSLDFHVMYKGTQTSKFATRIVMSTNNMPQFLDASGALAMRMMIFHFIKSFHGKEDFTLKDRLKGEIAGIAQWAIKGLERLRMRGKFVEATSTLNMKREVRDDMNPIAEFLDDRVTFTPLAFTSSNAIYATYKLWCEQTDAMPIGKATLCRLLNAGNYEIENCREDSVRGFRGLGVHIPEPAGIKKEP